jgi:polyhydroxyalkanoate synthesis regulator phasin
MPQSPDLTKYIDAGAEFVAMTRAQARKRAKELVSTGQLAQEGVQAFVDDLVDESRKRTDVLLDVVRKEIQRQVKTLGIATKDDLAKLESKIAKQPKGGAGAKPSAKAKKSAKKKSAAASAKKPAKTAKKAAKKAAKTAKKSTGKAASKAAS